MYVLNLSLQLLLLLLLLFLQRRKVRGAEKSSREQDALSEQDSNWHGKGNTWYW